MDKNRKNERGAMGKEEIFQNFQRSAVGVALMTEKETADLLRMKPQTLSVWRSRGGRGPAYIKVGASIRYQRFEVEKWLQKQTVKAE